MLFSKAVSMYKYFLSVKFGLSHFCLDFFLNLAMSQTFSKKKLQVANSTLVIFLKMKNVLFQKKYKCGIKAPIKSHTCTFFLNENFFISKKFTSVEFATCNFF